MMTLLDLRGGVRFLSEALPHEFPMGGLTETELCLWELYYMEKSDHSGKR